MSDAASPQPNPSSSQAPRRSPSVPKLQSGESSSSFFQSVPEGVDMPVEADKESSWSKGDADVQSLVSYASSGESSAASGAIHEHADSEQQTAGAPAAQPVSLSFPTSPAKTTTQPRTFLPSVRPASSSAPAPSLSEPVSVPVIAPVAPPTSPQDAASVGSNTNEPSPISSGAHE